MKFAQRGGSFNPTTEQQVEIISADTPEGAAIQLSTMIERYAVRVVSAVGYTVPDVTASRYVLVVVFEEESIHTD